MTGAYSPFQPAARPGERPPDEPLYRVLVHRRFAQLWEQLPQRVGLERAQQFYDHVAHTPGQPDEGQLVVVSAWEGRCAEVRRWFANHPEISGAGRINYQFVNAYTGGEHGDAHPVVFILSIDLGSH